VNTIDYTQELPVVDGKPSASSIDEIVSAPIDTKPGKLWKILITVTSLMLLIGAGALGWTFYKGIGVWGNNQPVGWGFDIVNFVFWVGIGHAGTLISAILFLLRQRWRTGIARFAEAMTIFAVMCAGIFPAIHTGRAWLDGYLFPYPNSHHIWVNFTSPLLWDVFAVSTYFTVSLIFWYIGLVPDLLHCATGQEIKSKKPFIPFSVSAGGIQHATGSIMKKPT